MGCAAGLLVMSWLLERDAVGPSDVDGRIRDLLGLIVCQRNDEEVWSEPSSMETRRLWSHERIRNGMFGLNLIDTNTANVGTKYLSATTSAVGIDVTVLLERSLGLLRWWPLSREDSKTSSAKTARCTQ